MADLLSFARAHILASHDCNIGSTIIETCSSCKYSSVHATNDASWTSCISAILTKPYRSLGNLCRQKILAPFSVKQQAYITLVRSEYASSTWSSWLRYLINDIEPLQNRKRGPLFSEQSSYASVAYLRIQTSFSTIELRHKLSRFFLLHRIQYLSSSIKSSLPLKPERFTGCDNSCNVCPLSLYQPLSRTHSLWTSLTNGIVKYCEIF